MPGKYVINFNENLTDGTYTIVVEDVAGNSVVGNQENQAFVIDTIAPIFGSPILLGEDDTGEIKEEYFTDKDTADNIITFSEETVLD